MRPARRGRAAAARAYQPRLSGVLAPILLGAAFLARDCLGLWVRLIAQTVPCHTTLMSYHENFWVVAGTAAPVIALAAVVALPDTSDMLRGFGQLVLQQRLVISGSAGIVRFPGAGLAVAPPV